MCCAAVRWLSCRGLLENSLVVAMPWLDFKLSDHPQRYQQMAETIRSELILYDPIAQSYQSGMRAFAQLLLMHQRYLPLYQLLQWPVVIAVSQFFYKTISMNRRIFSRRAACENACACDPPLSLLYRSSLMGLLLVVAGAAIGLGWLIWECLAGIGWGG